MSQILEDKAVQFSIPDGDEFDDAGRHRLAGIILASLFSALFWMGLLATAGAASGYPPSSIVLVTVGAAIAVFLIPSLRLLAHARVAS